MHIGIADSGQPCFVLCLFLVLDINDVYNIAQLQISGNIGNTSEDSESTMPTTKSIEANSNVVYRILA